MRDYSHNNLDAFQDWWEQQVLIKIDHDKLGDYIATPNTYIIYKTILNYVFELFDEKYRCSIGYQQDKGKNQNLIAEAVGFTLFCARDQLEDLFNHSSK